MRLFLDTHVFLWYISAGSAPSGNIPRRDPRTGQRGLLERPLRCCGGGRNQVRYRQAASAGSAGGVLPRQRAAHGIETLPIEGKPPSHLAGLPPMHRDPFDRMLIAQALLHGLTVAYSR